MKRCIFLLLLFFNFSSIWAQTGNSTCASAIQVCPNSGATFPASTSSPAAESGPDYGCLGTEPNPAWFYFQVNTPGTHSIDITNTGSNDLDFIVWGPFSSLAGYCNQLTAANTADCSYAGGASENVSFTSTTVGDYYVLLITNFSNQATNVNFIQTSGTGNFNCEFTGTCLISLTTAVVGTCDSLTNQYNVTGLIYTFNPPSSGSLTVSSLGVNSVYNSPLTSPFPYSLNGLPSNGAAATINFQFSSFPSCTANKNITAPSGCLPCTASITQNGPICEGEDLTLTTSFPSTATYQWVGPNGFTSIEQNPTILNASILSAGTYTVLITGQNCVGERSVDVEVVVVPKPIIFEAGTEVCEGEILFLGAAEIPGATFTWTGPNGFNVNARNTQILNSTPANSGTYIVQITLNNCSNRSDTVQAVVFPSPEVSIIGDTIQVPGSTAVFHVDGAAGYTYFWIFNDNSDLITSTLFTSDKDSVVVFFDNVEGELSMQIIVEDNNGCQSDPKFMNIQLTNSTGLIRVNENNIFLFPNPAKDKLYLNTAGNKYKVMDVTGKNVIESIFLKAEKEINISELQNGVYFICIDDRYFSKFIVEK